MELINRLLNSIRCHTKRVPIDRSPIREKHETTNLRDNFSRQRSLLLLSLRRTFFEKDFKSREKKGYLSGIEDAQNCSDRIPAPFFVFLDHRLVGDPSSITNTIAIKAFILINEKKTTQVARLLGLFLFDCRFPRSKQPSLPHNT